MVLHPSKCPEVPLRPPHDRRLSRLLQIEMAFAQDSPSPNAGPALTAFVQGAEMDEVPEVSSPSPNPPCCPAGARAGTAARAWSAWQDRQRRFASSVCVEHHRLSTETLRSSTEVFGDDGEAVVVHPEIEAAADGLAVRLKSAPTEILGVSTETLILGPADGRNHGTGRKRPSGAQLRPPRGEKCRQRSAQTDAAKTGRDACSPACPRRWPGAAAPRRRW